jgi:hypothetical protein
MSVVWGLVLVALSLLAWGGQTISRLAPSRATRLGLGEAEDDVEAVYWADIRGEAAWDAATLWTMVVAGALLIADHSWWPYFGLVGGGMYLYFSGRGILTRLAMQRRAFRIGAPRSVQAGYSLLGVWGVMAAITIGAAVAALS